MKKNLLLFAMGILCVVNNVYAQPGIFDPNDPIVDYDPSNPPATPPPNTLAKWIRTPRPEMWFSTNNYKSYYFNDMPFRLRYPNGYDPSNPDKKYPLIVFFHGIGEIGPLTDNEIQLYWGAYKFDNMMNAGEFNAFILFPTTQVGDWSPGFANVNRVLDSLQKYCNVDPDKLITMGLSLGGDGAMKYTFEFPKRSAVSIASSPGSIPTFIQNNPTSYVHVPFWIATGEFDEFSPPPTVQAYLNNFRGAGGDARWTLFPNMGHGVWNEHWEEPYLVPYWKAAHKANPLVFNQQNQFPPNTPINARIGITSGFAQYEWQKDNVTIPDANSNEIIATEVGSYRVRFMRESNGNWSEWSPNPAVISLSAIPPDDSPPSVPANLTVTSVSTNSININWEDATDNTGVTGYNVYVDGVLALTTTGSEALIENLSPNTSYSFTVTARDQAGNVSGVSNAATGTTLSLPDTNPPTVPENLTVVSTNVTSISLDWNDATDNTGVTGYDVYVDGILLLTTGGSEALIENLSPNTSYSFTVAARDQAGNVSGVSNAATGTTLSLPDTNPPTIPENLTVVSTNVTSISLDWNDATDNTGVTGYDVYVDGFLLLTTGGSEALIENLSPNTSYSFTVAARDQAGNVSGVSNAATGTTLSLSDTNPPTVPENLTVVSTNVTSISLDWNDATDNTGVTGYDVYVDGILLLTTGGSEALIENLSPNTSYSFTVAARDQAGNVSGQSNAVTGTMLSLPDVNPPTIPENLTVISGSPTSIGLDWNDASDNTGVSGYDVYIDGILINTVSGSEIIVENLLPNTSYSFAITARDQAGNVSDMSAAVTGTTENVPDLSPPSIPDNVAVLLSDAYSITLDWNDAVDNNGVTGYDVYVDGVFLNTISGSEILVNNLSPNTSYSFTVTARDQAGNVSELSAAVTGTTLDEPLLSKYDKNAAAKTATEHIEVSEAYPNPFIKAFSISFNNTSANNKIVAQVYDLSGKMVYSKYFGNISAGKTILRIDTGDKQLVDGIYFVKLQVSGKSSNIIKLLKR